MAAFVLTSCCCLPFLLCASQAFLLSHYHNTPVALPPVPASVALKLLVGTARTTAGARSVLSPNKFTTRHWSSSSSSSSTSTSTSPSSSFDDKPPSLRQIALVSKFARLPFWPIWHGLIIMFLDQIGFRELSQSLEATIGGRVAPMIYMPKPGVGERSEVEAFDFSTAGGFTEANKKKMEQEEKEMLSANLLALTDPFLMNVHHRHSFLKLDPFRWLQALIFPEGFPAHPHAGFNTLTYVLKGQMKHRDSMGVKQVYGNGAAQFLTAGNGVLHEEMWEFSKGRDMELFQIWINLPRRHKDIDPSLQLVGDTDNHDGKGPIPEITILSPSSSSSTSSSSVFSASPRGAEKKVTVRVLMGEAHGLQGKLESLTPMTVLHVSMDSGSSWAFPLPSHHTCHIYARKGPLDVLVDAGGGRDGGKPGLVRVETHETAFMKTGGELLQVHSPLDGKGGSDFLVLAGEPLREPVAASGPWVFNEASEATRAYARYQTGAFGLPWEHTLDDEAWRDVCRVGRRGGGGEGGGGGGGITRDL